MSRDFMSMMLKTAAKITVIPRYGEDFPRLEDGAAANRERVVKAWRAGEKFALLMLHPTEHAPPTEFVVSKRDFSPDCDICIKYDCRRSQVTIRND